MFYYIACVNNFGEEASPLRGSRNNNNKVTVPYVAGLRGAAADSVRVHLAHDALPFCWGRPPPGRGGRPGGGGGARGGRAGLVNMAKSYLKYEQELTFGIVTSCNSVQVCCNQHLLCITIKAHSCMAYSGIRSSQLLLLLLVSD